MTFFRHLIIMVMNGRRKSPFRRRTPEDAGYTGAGGADAFFTGKEAGRGIAVREDG